jgi:hypothetical protein
LNRQELLCHSNCNTSVSPPTAKAFILGAKALVLTQYSFNDTHFEPLKFNDEYGKASLHPYKALD